MIKSIKLIIYFVVFSSLYSQSFSDILKEKPLWTGSFGTVSIDGETYNQISLRPEFNVGKWGMGFDFYLYINSIQVTVNGKILTDIALVSSYLFYLKFIFTLHTERL